MIIRLAGLQWVQVKKKRSSSAYVPYLAGAHLFQIKEQATNGFQSFIVTYRDDPDQQNLIDWIQEGWVGELRTQTTFFPPPP